MVQIGNCLDLAKSLPDNSVDCIVTSPPYYGLRDYGTPEAWGLEPTLAEYLERIGHLFAVLFKVLKPSGTCWVNLGDSYSERGNSGGNNGITVIQASAIREKGYRKNPGFKRKELLGVPWRVAFMLQDQGWYLRQEIIWSKPNPMPESVRDRCTKSHEYVFLLTKSPKYFYDQDAIRQPFSDETKQLSYDTMDYKRRDNYKTPDGWDTGSGSHGSIHKNGCEKGKKNEQSGQRTKANLNKNWDESEANGTVKGANCRSVWNIATEAYPDAHFATFPTEIPRRCISAGCPVGGLVLDPFCGSGTTGMVARQLGREFIGFEINPEYAAMAERRIADVTPSMFTEAAS